MPIERKLAAIMFTDIAGYTESMSKSESKTLNLLEKKRSILKPLLKEYKGTFVKEIGDGTLSYFESAVNAATCAVKLQEKTYDDKEMNIRVGIHIGDIVFKDGDVFGGGVNVASRLESIAPAGGVCVSKNVYDELSNQDDFDGIELGLQSLKGVGRLIEVFGLKGDKLNEPDPQKYQENKVAVHSDDEVPSVAIIPFDNKGADEDVFYAYGISADLISDCSGAGLIRVASIKNIENLDYKILDTDELASKLLVRYVATGTLWKMDEIFQLSIELYDTKESKVVWSDRWEEVWDNLTTIKGNLSDGLLKALDTKPKVEHKVESTITEAYEYYLRGKYKWQMRGNMEDVGIALELLQKAIQLDDNLLGAKEILGIYYMENENFNKSIQIFRDNLAQAEKMRDKRHIGYCIRRIGTVHTSKGEYDKALDCYHRSLEIFKEIDDKDGLIRTYNGFGVIYNHKYYYDKATYYYTRALDISKEIGDKRGMGVMLSNLSNIYHTVGDFDKWLDYTTRSLKVCEEVGFMRFVGYKSSSMGSIYYNNGEYEKAIEYFDKSLKILNNLGIKTIELDNNIKKNLSYKHLGYKYDVKSIHTLIKKTEKIGFDTNYYIYQLLKDTSYLETAYNEVQKIANNLEPDVAAKFLSCPIPSAIAEEWEKVK